MTGRRTGAISQQVVLAKFDTVRVEKISIHRQLNAYDDGSGSQVNAKDRHIQSSGTPPGCRRNTIAFPVVSADSDHRRLSLQPFAFRGGRVNYIVRLTKAGNTKTSAEASLQNVYFRAVSTRNGKARPPFHR
jgi:hypothetical protein